MTTEQDLRAALWGYRAMFAEARDALLYIVNEADSKTDCVNTAQLVLDELGEPE